MNARDGNSASEMTDASAIACDGANETTHESQARNADRGSAALSIAVRLLAGQALACCIALTGIFSSLLAARRTSVSLLQSATAYGLIFVVAAPMHVRNSRAAVAALASPAAVPAVDAADTERMPLTATPRGPASLASVLERGVDGVFASRFPLWRYGALAVCDVAASYFAIRAYSYTDITSAQLLDAATIFTVMALGYAFLGRRFGWRHCGGVALSLAGMVALVYIDATGRSRSSDKTAPDAVLGDAMTLIASVLYGVTNVGCEALLKSDRVRAPEWMRACSRRCGGATCAADAPGAAAAARQSDVAPPLRRAATTPTPAVGEHDVVGSFPLIVEYVAFLSLFGLALSVLLLVATPSLAELRDAATRWTWQATLFQVAFSCVMVATYLGLPALLKLTSATFACLSLLTADVYAVVLNYATTGVAPTGWYYLSAAAILTGVVIFDVAPDDGRCACGSSADDATTDPTTMRAEADGVEHSATPSPLQQS